EFMSTSIVLPATVVSDGLSCFTVAQEMGMAHNRTVTGGGRGSVEVEEHWAVNTILGNLKTAMTGTYHAIKFAKYAHRYLAEVQYRFNRRYDLRAILPRLVRAVAVTPAISEAGVRAC
ncbi:MAG TPA: transposase, partial [Rubrivivax sp.]|nr:transposase [Rubrivivax sp.]